MVSRIPFHLCRSPIALAFGCNIPRRDQVLGFAEERAILHLGFRVLALGFLRCRFSSCWLLGVCGLLVLCASAWREFGFLRRL